MTDKTPERAAEILELTYDVDDDIWLRSNGTFFCHDDDFEQCAMAALLDKVREKGLDICILKTTTKGDVVECGYPDDLHYKGQAVITGSLPLAVIEACIEVLKDE